MVRFSLILFFLQFTQTIKAQVYIPKFDVQGHRGARGLKPENTIPAFITALDYGVTTIELDVVITKDKEIIVSHEPWISEEICLKPDSTIISIEEKASLNIYQMNYKDVILFDCGSKENVRFPQQDRVSAHKPLLRDVIISVEDHIKSYSQYEVDYNIEIKSTKAGDNKLHPPPEEYSDMVYAVIDQYLPWERVVIQSFDFRVLKYWNKKYPNVRLAALVENLKSANANLKELGFTPSIYSPYFVLLKKQTVDALHQKKIRVILWTVNEKEDMRRLKNWGADGFITDYPNRASEMGLGLRKITVPGK